MADSDSGAILMAFYLQKGVAIDGESTTSLKAADGVSDQMLLKGFAPKKMFEVTTFTFSTEVEDVDQQANPDSAKLDKLSHDVAVIKQAQAQLARAGTGGRVTGVPPGTSRPGNYARWRASRDDLAFKGRDGRGGYQVNVQPVSFSRALDTTSFRLMKSFLTPEPFHSAALVKRKPAGTKAAGEAYLRIDFEDVLIINIDWSDDEPVKETVKFISRVITLQYRPQLPDGSLGETRQASYAPMVSDRQ